MEQQNERAMIFEKIVASDMTLVFGRPPGRRGPAKVCEAKFCGEKEEQGSGRMAFFVKNKKRRSKANFGVAAPRAAGPPGKFAQAKFHGEEEE